MPLGDAREGGLKEDPRARRPAFAQDEAALPEGQQGGCDDIPPGLARIAERAAFQYYLPLSEIPCISNRAY